MGRAGLYRMARELAASVIERHRRRLRGRGRGVTIDRDPTDDRTHGAQQLTFFNGHYDSWCYLPLLAFLTFDDEVEQYLCAAVLRPGNAVAADGTVGVLSRRLPMLRAAFPRVRFLVRLDGGFATPEILNFLDAEPGLDYVVAMAKNAVLQRHAEPAMEVARAQSEASGPSRHNLRIDGLEFTASIVDLHLPVDTALGAIDVAGPRRHFTVQRLAVADAASAQALARQGTELVLRDVQPTPVFRRVAELEATNQFSCPHRLEHFVEGALRVRIEVVAHQGDPRAVGVAAFQQTGDLHRPVRLRAPGAGRRLPPTRQRLAEQEDRGRAGPLVLVVHAARSRGGRGHRRSRFLDQLHRLLVHADNGTIRVVGLLIPVQDLLHVRHELRIGLRRDHPVLDFPLGHPVFFSVLRMVSWLTDPTIANSTTRRANSRNDQLA